MNEPQRILVRGVNWLGDAVMTTPALLRLRERFPKAHIVQVTPAKLADMWAGHPAVDEVLPFAAGEGAWSVGRRIKEARCDTALVLPNSFRSALEVFLGGVPRRIGLGANARSWLLTQTVAPLAGVQRMRKRTPEEVKALIARPGPVAKTIYRTSDHQLHHYLHLAAALGASSEPVAPLLTVSAEERAAVCARFGVERDDARPWLGLNAGAEYGPAKRWPSERFIEAAVTLQKRTGCRWLVFGGKGDMELAGEITARIEAGISQTVGKTGPLVVNVAGQTSLRELCALFSACKLLLTNDTGPMHVAAAVGIPVVVPFGSTSPELTGPGLPGDPRHHFLRAEAACAPCFLRECPIDFRCQQGIEVERVISLIGKLISSSVV